MRFPFPLPVGLAAALVLTTPVFAADEKTLPLEPARHISFETTEATWLSLDLSPDGQTLVLEILGDLYTVPAVGGDATAITRGMAYDSQPRFSPDGSRIAFVSDRDGNENVWVVDGNGDNPRRISKGGRGIEFASPSWAPDGSHVVVSRTTWGLGTFELWAYHPDGGSGVRLTKAKASKDTPTGQRHNALGPAYDPDGRHLYYAVKQGGFGYNLQFPQWQVARRDLRTGDEDVLTQAQGSAFRPLLSPDGRWLVYGTRHEQATGLRIRELATGQDRWLAYPVQRDEQESRFTRDLLPGYAFTPDARFVIFTAEGGIRRVSVETGVIEGIPFRAAVEQDLGPRLHFPYRLGVGPVKARLIRDPALSPDGSRLAFSAFAQVYVYDLADRTARAVTPEGMLAFHPAWAPDGRELAFVSWTSAGGHIWRVRANGRARPRQLTEHPAYYTDPAWSPDGDRIVALRATSYERLYRESDYGAPVGSDVVWLPARGGAVSQIVPSRGLTAPHFGPERDRVYLYLSAGDFPRGGSSGLVSIRYDGTDRRSLLSAKGPGIYYAEENVPASDIRLAPDGRHALIHHANQLYVAALLNRHLQDLTVNLKSPPVPVARITDVGADFFGWDRNGSEIFWTVGHQVYRRPLASVTFGDGDDNGDEDDGAAADDADADAAPGATDTADSESAEPLAEAHEAVTGATVEIYRPRARPEGAVALVGATVLTFDDDTTVLEDAVVVVEGDRIAAVGARDAVTVPDGARIIDVGGQFVLPGFVDTHAHFRPLRRVLDTENWGFLANLAYGVTTGLDVQPSTTDVLAYQDLIDAGLMTGPRALSTGPGIFSNNDFRSRAHTEAVLRRYKDHYRVHNLKAYIAGNREQRQWIVMAAEALELMPTTEGSLDMKLDMTHAIDGFSGNEHNFPVLNLYRDTVELVARSGMAYTPTLLVSYGGPWSESWFYTRENPHRDAKLRRFTPSQVIAARTLRSNWFHEDEFVFEELAEQAAKIIRAGGRVGVGAHGQLQGLGYHWELWALASGGLTPTEALTAATRHGAEIIGVADDIGSISVGKLADLVVLGADPLLDIRNTADITYVMKNGELWEADTMDKVWPQAEPLPPQWWWRVDPGPNTREGG